MPFLERIGDRDKVPHVLAAFPNGTGRPLIELHEALLRGESPFTAGQRELIAAFVSAVNACSYCAGAHGAAAAEFGIPEETIDALIDDIERAPVEPVMRPVLKMARKLTLTPSRMIQADIDAVLDAGWGERGVYDAIQVTALYNLMNRLVDGLGLSVIPEDFAMEGGMLKKGYTAILDNFDIR